MFPLTIATYSLLGTGLGFGIIELGLSAYAVSKTDRTYECYTDQGTIGTCKETVPSVFIFYLFVSIWTLITTPATLILPWKWSQQTGSSSSNTLLGSIMLAKNFLTAIFWLAAFADLANLTDGYLSYAGGVIQAMVAFGVLNWLIFMTLFILGILAVTGVLRHDLLGWQPMISPRQGSSNAHYDGAPSYNTAAAHQEPKNETAPEMVA
jgi:hypothetical protein